MNGDIASILGLNFWERGSGDDELFEASHVGQVSLHGFGNVE